VLVGLHGGGALRGPDPGSSCSAARPARSPPAHARVAERRRAPVERRPARVPDPDRRSPAPGLDLRGAARGVRRAAVRRADLDAVVARAVGRHRRAVSDVDRRRAHRAAADQLCEHAAGVPRGARRGAGVAARRGSHRRGAALDPGAAAPHDRALPRAADRSRPVRPGDQRADRERHRPAGRAARRHDRPGRARAARSAARVQGSRSVRGGAAAAAHGPQHVRRGPAGLRLDRGDLVRPAGARRAQARSRAARSHRPRFAAAA
jgi:hypothetical protein